MSRNIIDNLFPYLKVYQYDTSKKTKLGGNGDGGYVIAELDNINVPIYDCFISAGIGSNDMFSIDFLNKYNLDKSQCFAIDGTIHAYPYNDLPITFIKKNIGIKNNDNTTNLDDITNKYNNIFLKMDIEAAEIPWINSLDIEKLKKFRQIVLEVHSLVENWAVDLSFDFSTEIDDIINMFKKLFETHYIVHIHGNIGSNKGNKIFDAMEITFLNKNLFNEPPLFNTTPFPIYGLDHDYDVLSKPENIFNHPPYCFP